MSDADAQFETLVLARLRLHRRRRRRSLLAGAGVALVAAAMAWLLLPGSPEPLLTITAGDVVAALVLVAVCCTAWVMLEGDSAR